jgi:hypothetical protein
MNPMNQMFETFSQMLCMPFTAFNEALSRTVHDWRPPLPAPCAPCAPCGPVGDDGGREDRGHDDRWSCRDTRHHDGWDGSCSTGGWRGGEGRCGGCGRSHDDCHCHRDRCDGCGRSHDDCCCGSRRRSDTLKLVEYSLVSVRRGRKDRKPLASGQRVISANPSLESFRYEVIVDYVSSDRLGAAADARDLRVYTRGLDCWCKSEFDFEEDQVEALNKIARRIKALRPEEAEG